MAEKDIAIYLDRLINEIDLVRREINSRGSELLSKGRYSEVELIVEKGKRTEELLERIQSLRDTWENSGIISSVSDENKPLTKIKSISLSKNLKARPLPKGLRTTEDQFIVPILESLIELGGTAPMRLVLERVEMKLKDKLTKEDFKNLSSRTKATRWINTAQWCRAKLVKTGLMSKDSERGIWKITEEGTKSINKNSSLFQE